MVGMRLAGFGRMMVGMCAMARSRMGVMRSGFRIVFFIVFGSFAMMTRGFFVVLSGVVMVFADRVLV